MTPGFALPPVLAFDELYVDTAAGRRLRAVFEEALRDRSWIIVGAHTGAGKSTEIDEFVAAHRVERFDNGTTRAPVIVGSPGTTGRSLRGLDASLMRNFGTVRERSLGGLTERLMREMVACRTELVILDDSHGASAEELLHVKRLIDIVTREATQKVGLVLVCAATPGQMPLRELVNQPTLLWAQFRRRLSPTKPWRFVASLSLEEILDPLAGYEQTLRESGLPELRLQQWRKRIHEVLTTTLLDPDVSGRVTMQNLRNLVDGVSRILTAEGLADIPEDGAVIAAVANELARVGAVHLVDEDPEDLLGGEITAADAG